MSELVPSRWQTLLDFVTHPFLFVQGVIEYGMAWIFTRPWQALIWYSPVLLLLGSSLGLVLWGWAQTDSALLLRYVDLYEQIALEESNAVSEDDRSGRGNDLENPLLPHEKTTEYGVLILRRILELEEFNARANYLVAYQLGLSGRLGQARQMMRQLAGGDTEGYAPAHAWLAADRLIRLGVHSEQDRQILLHDLEIATQWEDCNPLLMAAYADLLESMGRPNDALAVLGRAAAKEPDLQLKLANMAYRHNQKKPLQEASEEARRQVEQRIESGRATPEDYAKMANLELLDGDYEAAIKHAESGLRISPSDRLLKRLLSEGLRLKYRHTARITPQQAQVNLGLLDAALKIDPENTAVTEEVARILLFGESLPDEMVAQLERQLLDGQASAMTHLMLAMRQLKDNHLAEAVPHLEIALEQAPNNPVILNNLALSLARLDPSQLDRPIELIEKAIAVQPQNPELFDTHGEILMMAGDLPAAIERFEEALRLDRNRVVTRRKLADAYEQFGLGHLATMQRREAERLENEAKGGS